MLKKIFDWSEVWALLIPIAVLVVWRKPQPGMKPIIYYLIIAFFLNLCADIIGEFKRMLTFLPQSNNPIYNLHSVVRFACFSWFFLQKGKQFYPRIQVAIIFVFVVFLLVNFSYFENFLYPLHLSGNLFSTEAFLSLAGCMVYYLAMLKNDQQLFYQSKDFWVVTGISTYFVITFFIFLFYEPMIIEHSKLADWMWNFHNFAYIAFCIFISKAFYATPGN